MAIETSSTFSVLEGGEWFETGASDVEGAARAFAEHKGWSDGTWTLRYGSTPRGPHWPVAKRSYRVTRAYGRSDARRTEIQAEPVGFILRKSGAKRAVAGRGDPAIRARNTARASRSMLGPVQSSDRENAPQLDRGTLPERGRGP